MSTKKKLQQLDEDLDSSFSNVKLDINNLHGRIDRWSTQFGEMRNELATNGVVGNLHRLMKSYDNLERQVAAEFDAINKKFADLESNGVVTSINKLNTEVFKDTKESKKNLITNFLDFYMNGDVTTKDITLSGKVDAIIAHLGIDIEIQPEKTTAQTVKVTTKSVNKKKAGKK